MSDRAVKNRWWSFSLRTLLVVVTQFAVAFAIAPACVERYAEWKQAQEQLAFDELITLIITTTVKPTSGWDDELHSEFAPDEPSEEIANSAP